MKNEGRILRTLLEAGRVLTGRKPAGRALTVFPDDTFIISYPRSGNTWTRFLVGNLVYQDAPVTFANVESRIPEIYLFPDRVLRGMPRARLLKSHECFDPRYRKVIYIVRDPRDVAVSYYHYAIKLRRIEDGYEVEKFIRRFVTGEFDVQWSWAASWSDHVLSWVSMRQGSENFLLLRYEDMLESPEEELAKVAKFLGIDASQERVVRAVQLSSADTMRQLEKRQAENWALTRNTRRDKPFIRGATAGRWRTELPPSSVGVIERAWGPTMERLGYKLSESGRENVAVAADVTTSDS